MNDTSASARIIKREAQGIAAPAPSGRTVAFAFAAALTLVALWMARNFLLPITWAIILVITTWPFYCRFVQYMPRHRTVLPPLAFTLLIALLLILPLGFVTFDVAREVVSAAAWVAHAQQDGIPPPDWVARLPLMGDRAVTWWHAHLSEPHAAGHLLDLLDPGVVANWAGIFGAQLVQITVFLVVTLLAVFLLLHNGERLGHLARLLVDRLRGDVSECFADRLTAAVGAVVTGTVLVALGESALIGAGYVVAGVPRPALFATLTAVCAMLPLGSWVVFAAAALLLFAQGRAGIAAGLFGFGAVIALVGDHIVQPLLVGGRVRLPFLVTLIGIFGGLETFGLVGLLLGPVIMTAVLMVWRELIASRAA